MSNAFGEYNFATKKAKRMLYWMPKIKHTNPYLDRRHVENKDLSDVELARIALKMICRDAGTTFSYFKVFFKFLLKAIKIYNWTIYMYSLK